MIKKSFYFKLSAHLRYYLEGDRPSQTNKLKFEHKSRPLSPLITRSILNVFKIKKSKVVFH